MLAKPNCYKRKCIHFMGVINETDEEINEMPYCLAFPKGIPYEIAYGNNDHTKPFKSDNGIQYKK